jgi:hypothetical protein
VEEYRPQATSAADGVELRKTGGCLPLRPGIEIGDKEQVWRKLCGTLGGEGVEEATDLAGRGGGVWFLSGDFIYKWEVAETAGVSHRLGGGWLDREIGSFTSCGDPERTTAVGNRNERVSVAASLQP